MFDRIVLVSPARRTKLGYALSCAAGPIPTEIKTEKTKKLDSETVA